MPTETTRPQAYQCGACETPYDTSEAAAACCGHSERGMSREDARRAGLAFQQPTRWAAELERDKIIIFGVTVAVLACGLAVLALLMWWVRS